MAKYRITGQSYYRPGDRLYPVGAVVELPDGEKPAPGWEPVDPPAKAAPPPQKPKS